MQPGHRCRTAPAPQGWSGQHDASNWGTHMDCCSSHVWQEMAPTRAMSGHQQQQYQQGWRPTTLTYTSKHHQALTGTPHTPACTITTHRQ
jgi:hypothetical protein